MKKSILIIVVLGVAVAGAMLLATRPVKSPQAEPTADSAVTAADVKPAAVVKQATAAPKDMAGSNAPSHGPAPGSPESIAFAAAIDTLASAHSTYAERQAAWKELMASGRIRDAIAELEQRAANDPQNAQIAADLGLAYLKACTTTDDVRDKAQWAMQADRDFDTALGVDPQNWDARFTKAVAMSYWPDNLNKGPEVINQFNTLIQQQEKEAPQPQYAQAYDWLGQEYAKTGQPDLAQQTWQRGASLFPDNQALQNRLATPATAQQ